MTTAEKIELFHKLTKIQTKKLVAHVMVAIQPPAFINGEGLHTYMKYQAMYHEGEEELEQIIKTYDPHDLKELYDPQFISDNNLLVTIEKQRSMINELCGMNMSVEELVEWASKK